MNTRVKIPQMAGVRRSVEVKHGTKGVGRMLRRGLHGSKNWVLELDENGEHRGAWAKLFRVLVVLMPVWILASAMTGGPERGGQSVGPFQSVVGALLVLLVGLAVFSARERRLGREEPWQDFDDADDSTESDDGEAKTLVAAPPEDVTRDSESSQVTELSSEGNGESGEDDSEISTETARIEQVDLHPTSHQATSEEPETVAIAAPEAPTAVLPPVMQQATPVTVNTDEADQSFDVIASVVEEFRQKDMQQAIPESPYSLVKQDVEPMQPELQQSTSDWTSVDVSDSTESDDGTLDDAPTTPLRTTVQGELHEGVSATESSQVSLEKEAVRQPLQGVLQVQFADPGPYPAKDDPVHEEWWVVAPDVEPEEAPPGPMEEPPAVTEPEPESESADTVAQMAPAHMGAEGAAGRHHPIVLAYFASQAPKSGFTMEEKDQARSELIAWLRREISEEHLSRAEASRMLGVDPSTVTRWLSDDPWAG